ncbi:DUF983 domain-containing protein [Methylobrevis pamukkalensis]|uniref:Zinc-finger protein n=1 Tax=Methylobrevis pamukkalensis TaxID=1439726 RepID=A0A1E3H121_9HYPH|nr:DUF983 domain-containing protein [Methylobrevis pamukkalensis]ODN70019.1 hypothetical protein A6302_02675 [Methylobrevis pamukkalensis]
MTIETWSNEAGASPDDVLPPRPTGLAMKRGLRCRCPACGEGRLFRAYLKVAPTCPACGEDLSHQRADDAPPYFTIVIVGHIVVPLALAAERELHPEMWIQMTVWPLLALVMSLLLLPPIKGAVVGFQWARYMHGFDPRGPGDDDIPADPAALVAKSPA